ncbi:Com family DNA-binding transcriptional regulator [Shinella sp. G-2]|uniref:Com family DNA-binding transcriptional regulator n=1 Tax=Shinella sp. G-2 TaxID=3133141 RepID=UPI003D0847F7
MRNVRCGSCRALLFRARQNAIAGDIEIKCRRCGTLNHLRPYEPFSDRPERPKRTNACGSSFP